MDPLFFDRLEQRAQLLERTSAVTREHIGATQRGMRRVGNELRVQILALQREMDELEREVHANAQRVRNVVDRFQNVAKRGDLARVQARLSVWAPEKNVSRGAFTRLLEE